MSPIHPIRPSVPDAHDRQVLTGLRAILSATTIDDCRDALVRTTLAIEEMSGLSIAMAEVLPGLGDNRIVWRTEAAAALLGTEFSAWFQNARGHLGRCLAFGTNKSGLVMAAEGRDTVYVAGVADTARPPPDLTDAMRDAGAIAAAQLQKLRREDEFRLRRERLDAEARRSSALIEAGADLLWQAGADGIVQVSKILHGRRDLAKAFQGLPLCSVLPDEDKIRATPDFFRARRVTFPRVAEPVLLTACVDPDDPHILRGTISAGPDVWDERKLIEASTLEAIVAGRQREEQLRRETEVMVLGLRLILSDLPFREKMQRLAQHLTNAIHCDAMRMILSRPGEPPHLLFPAGSANAQSAVERVADLGSGRTLTFLPAQDKDTAFIAAGLDMPRGDIALVTLPAEAERYYMLARARQPLSANDYGLIERMSLLFEQALSLQAEHKRTVHTAKLSALGQMSTSIAHELRQPLNAISMAAQNLEMMAENGALGAEALQEKARRILNQIDRATRVMDRMRCFGRKSKGDYRPASLSAIVRSVRSLMDAVVAAAGVSLDVSVADEHRVEADELEIEQVLVNLIQNAVDAITGCGERRSSPGRIRLWSQADPNDPEKLHLCVEDNGPGFTQETSEHALKAFFTTKPEGKGTGLGLSIAHAIMREHGGQLILGQGGDGGGLVSLVFPRPQADGLASSAQDRRQR